MEVICSAAGQPAPVITWKRQQGTHELASTDESRVNFDSVLIAEGSVVNLPVTGPIMRVEKVESSHAGSYSCQASNGVGEDLVAHFSLLVKGTLAQMGSHSFYPPLGPFCCKHTK